jgi:NAD-dependent SIR2 family protein deacetylase
VIVACSRITAGIKSTKRCTSDNAPRPLALKRPQRVLPTVRYLRPSVRLDEKISDDLAIGEESDRVFQASQGCDLLLIVGTSLRPDGIYSFVRSLAKVVKEGQGAIVLVNREAVKSRKGSEFIDFHLQVDIEECATRMIEEMGQVRISFSGPFALCKRLTLSLSIKPHELSSFELWHKVWTIS